MSTIDRYHYYSKAASAAICCYPSLTLGSSTSSVLGGLLRWAAALVLVTQFICVCFVHVAVMCCQYHDFESLIMIFIKRQLQRRDMSALLG